MHSCFFLPFRWERQRQPSNSHGACRAGTTTRNLCCASYIVCRSTRYMARGPHFHANSSSRRLARISQPAARIRFMTSACWLAGRPATWQLSSCRTERRSFACTCRMMHHHRRRAMGLRDSFDATQHDSTTRGAPRLALEGRGLPNESTVGVLRCEPGHLRGRDVPGGVQIAKHDSPPRLLLSCTRPVAGRGGGVSVFPSSKSSGSHSLLLNRRS